MSETLAKQDSSEAINVFWWVFALRGGFALLFALLLFFAGSLFGTIFFDPIMLVFLSMLLGFYVLLNGLLFAVAARVAAQHHLRFWLPLLVHCLISVAIGIYIGMRLEATPQSLAVLAGIQASAAAVFQADFAFRLKQSRSGVSFLGASALISLGVAAFFFTHHTTQIPTMAHWLSWYEALLGLDFLLIAYRLHTAQPRFLVAQSS